jgi:hypothetical protein
MAVSASPITTIVVPSTLTSRGLPAPPERPLPATDAARLGFG